MPPAPEEKEIQEGEEGEAEEEEAQEQDMPSLASASAWIPQRLWRGLMYWTGQEQLAQKDEELLAEQGGGVA